MKRAFEVLKQFGLEQYVSDIEIGSVIPFRVDAREIVSVCESLTKIHGLPLKTMSAIDDRKDTGMFRICYVFGVPASPNRGELKENLFLVPYLTVDPNVPKFPSLVPTLHQTGGYEREIRTFFGLEPEGNPDTRLIHLHGNWPKGVYPLRKEFDGTTRPEMMNEPYAFGKMEGEGVYVVPVGPVHAGIIEPGHFRFSMLGEEVVKFEAQLGWVHKGVEKLFETLPMEKKIALAERVSGDSTVAHALAYAQAIESLSDMSISKRAAFLRMIFAEMERLANHFNDIGFIMLDTGFSFGGANGARLRERIMQWNERLSGNRYFRGVIVPGGVTMDIPEMLADELADDLERIENDFEEVFDAAMESDSLLNRLKGTGALAKDIALDHGVTGVPIRALGEGIDARSDFPYAGYESVQFGIPTEESGDVYARFLVKIREIRESFRILNQVLTLLPYEANDMLRVEQKPLRAKSISIGIVEGWRGDIVYFVATDREGNISRVKVRDPSFLNWQIFPYVFPNDMLPDFPLINKSFNLSYSGNDL